MSQPSFHAIEEMLPAHCLLVCSLAHPFSGVLFCPEHREVSAVKLQSGYLALHAHVTSGCCPLLFLVLAVFLILSWFRLRLNRDNATLGNAALGCNSCPVEDLPPIAHSCSTTVLFLSFAMDFYFSYSLLPSRSLEKELLVTIKIQ